MLILVLGLEARAVLIHGFCSLDIIIKIWIWMFGVIIVVRIRHLLNVIIILSILSNQNRLKNLLFL